MSDWVFGIHAVRAAIDHDRKVEMVWLQQGRRDRRIRDLHAAAIERGVATRWVAKRRLDNLAGDRPHNGCAARVAPVALAALEDVIADEDRPGRLLLLDGVSDPHNLGAVIRTSASFGIDGLIVAGPSSPPFDGAAARSAAGHLASVPIVRATVAADVVAVLRGSGYWAFGADMGGTQLAEVRPIDRWVLCLGDEHKGLRAKTRSVIDELVGIPMAKGVESLNLSVAAGVMLYHLCSVWNAGH